MPYADKSSPAAIESQKRSSRKYYAANRDKIIAYASAWSRENKSRVNERAVVRRSQKMPIEHVLYWNARNRAKAQGTEFAITKDDIVVPATCPVLGLPLKVGTGSANAGSPSLDRIDPSKGYVRGNIRVISHKANTIKSDATLEDLRAVLRYMEHPHGG